MMSAIIMGIVRNGMAISIVTFANIIHVELTESMHLSIVIEFNL